jgi:hypothetical protein
MPLDIYRFVVKRASIPHHLNTTTREEIGPIPGAGDRMAPPARRVPAVKDFA